MTGVCVCVCRQRETTSNDAVTGRDVTDDRDDVTGGDRTSTDATAVADRDDVLYWRRETDSRLQGHPTGGSGAEELEYMEVDSGRGTSVDPDHAAADNTARSSYRTSLIDEDVSTLY